MPLRLIAGPTQVTLSETQTLANKTLTSPVLNTPDFNGSVATNTFEMMRALLRESQISFYNGWADATTITSGTGGVTAGASRVYLNTGATHASTAGVRDRPRLPGTAAAYTINWAKKFFLAFSITPAVTDFTNLIIRVQITQANTIGTLAAHGLGFHTAAAAIKLASYGTGGSEQLVDAATDVANTYTQWILIEHDPASADRLYVNGGLKATQSTAANIPSTEPAASYNILPSIARAGGADTADEAVSIANLVYGQDL